MYANLDTLYFKNYTGKAPDHGECSSDPFKYTVAIYTAIPPKILGTTLLTLEKYIFICSFTYHFCCFSSLSIMSIFRSVF